MAGIISQRKLEEFRSDENSRFSIIYGPSKINSEQKESILLILDSSFNPPHYGHYTLIKRAIESYNTTSNVDISVLLLLSVKNADKGEKPAAFDKRLDMMELLSDHIQGEFPSLNPTVAVCKSAKFVDKSISVRNVLFEKGKIVYLLGFDTITRVLDPKYYVPQTLEEAMGDFMTHTRFFCLTRGEEDDKTDSQEFIKQMKYVDDISDGIYEPIIPRKWGSKIKIEVNNNSYCSISSSEIRRSLMQKDYASAKGKLPSNILEYIIESDKEAKSSIFI
ncbi:hypothetical protein C6P45_004815 [Maudiozyma exigua]|uniref:Cytidyltransferase-like domain-containing protein n=1 Tax=Maudiozyma exigua TaxID=34358 RepID=A0A9P6WCP9_MAUEX|nr:hypothetical protein C6P45_004815 [Kazachstania exigua]